jgi:hypothetical protein
MTPAETARLLVFVSAICPSENRHEMSTEIWYPQVADLPATDALTATIQLARRRCDVTAGDVRAEVLTMRGQRLAQGSSSPAGAETSDSCRAGALRVTCPWCGAAPGEPCTVRGSDTRLRKAPAHPLRLIAEGTCHDR